MPVMRDNTKEAIRQRYDYPPVLALACVEGGDYMVGLRDGKVAYFKRAERVDHNWIRLCELSVGRLPDGSSWTDCPGELEVRVTEIACVGSV